MKKLNVGLNQIFIIGIILLYCSNHWTGKTLGFLFLLSWAILFFTTKPN